MDEKFLHHIWDGGHLKPELKTVSGKSLRIGYQGQYNTNRGPDFLNCGIVLDASGIRGDVEIHQQTSDWHAHNHSEDHHYNNVILHVVYHHNGARNLTIKENGETVEILELEKQLSEDIDMLIRDHQPRLPQGRPAYCDLLSALDKDRLEMTLRDMGLKRMQGKVRRFNASLMFSDFDQILYEGLFEAMGYDKNKTAMLSLAQEIPLAKLLSWQNEGLPALDTLAIFAISSGLLPKSSKLVPASLADILNQAWETQNRFSVMLDINWQLFRIRPANHPIFRMLALIPMLSAYGTEGLMTSFLRLLHPRLAAAQRDKAFEQMFSETTLPGAESLYRPGKAVLNSIYVNVCLPLFYLWGQKTGNEELLNQTQTAYINHKGLSENYLTRLMAKHIDPAYQKLVNTKAIYQQALIELHQRFCKYHFCDECRKQRLTPSHGA